MSLKKYGLILSVLMLLHGSVSGQSQPDSLMVGDSTQIDLADSDSTHVLKIYVISESDSKADSVLLKRDEQLKETVGPPALKDIFSFGKVFWSVMIIAIGYLIIRFLTKIMGILGEKSTTYRITIKGLIPILRIFGWITILYIIIAGIFKPPQATIIAFTASLGVAVAFASQDILKNIFGGIVILFDRPFSVGDKIQVGEHYGEVLEIGLRSIRIVTADDSLITVPNAELINQSVSNSNTGEPNCQVVAEIYLPITVDTARARQIAIESAQVSKYIYLKKPIAVIFVNEVKERRSYLKMRLKAYVMDIRYEFAFKSDMTEIVVKELLDQKIIKPEDVK
ncbi:mechanosensitive ion channel [Fulvivirgaceae bacterium BMA10]|uniref:Mechanosensitive ion channel n=1 Tax=Splendidivirga corallicola TaxID=3051826 RepID=A0ABT8KT06_9BACT|nr:mechanosensitive ion channel [Fulvivirgaceae bacterium BMA10]